MTRPFPLYHWSPIARRASILRQGLMPGRLARDATWRPPYVCFSDSPSAGWGLSGALSDEAGEWDLWMTWSSCIVWRRRADCPTEYRTRQRVYKRDLWYVATRAHAL